MLNFIKDFHRLKKV